MNTEQTTVFTWRKSYERSGRTHWALCDTMSDRKFEGRFTSCPYMVLLHDAETGFDGRPIEKQYFPELILRLLNEHFAKQ